MAKALKMYAGNDTAGRPINVAESTSGAWFWREYVWNGFGYAWTKWESLNNAVVFPEKIKCQAEYSSSPEYIDIPEEDRFNQIEWGFGILRIVAGPYRVRLP